MVALACIYTIFCGACRKTKDFGFRLTKVLPSHFFSRARFSPQVEPKGVFAGQRARVQGSSGGGCEFLLRDNHLRSFRGPGFEHPFPLQLREDPRLFLATRSL